MKFLEYWINVVYYCYYKFDVKLHYLFDKINPGRLIELIPKNDTFIKKYYPNWNRKKEYHKSMTNPETGFSSIVSSVVLFGLLLFLVLGVIIIMFSLLEINFIYEIKYFIIPFLFTIFINHYFTLSNNKYLKYFKTFENLPKNKKWNLALVTIILSIVCIVIFLVSLKFKLKTSH